VRADLAVLPVVEPETAAAAGAGAVIVAVGVGLVAEAAVGAASVVGSAVLVHLPAARPASVLPVLRPEE